MLWKPFCQPSVHVLYTSLLNHTTVSHLQALYKIVICLMIPPPFVVGPMLLVVAVNVFMRTCSFYTVSHTNAPTLKWYSSEL